MRRLVYLLLLAAPLSSAHADSQWEVAPIAAQGCVMGRTYDGGTRLSIYLRWGREWGIGFSNPDWDIEALAQSGFRINVDGHMLAAGTATNVSRQVVVLPISTTSLNTLVNGRKLFAEIGGAIGAFPLEGFSDAIHALRACVEQVNRPENQTTGGAAGAEG